MSYMEGLESREVKSRTLKSILANKSVMLAMKLAREALQRGEEHPKMGLLLGLLQNELKDDSVIVFAQFRSTTKKLTSLLKENGIAAKEFVGKGVGVTQAQQQSTIESFRKNEFKVLVATSIGEEGLDIPTVDAVVFYEPIPNEIRSIQRKGRAGRMKFGKVMMLVTKGTKDETYLFISRIREKRMKDTVLKIKANMDIGISARSSRESKQRTLGK
jgi:ERCC4-related helicase